MATKSSAFGRTELSGKDAARFLVLMNEGKPNLKAKENLKKGKLLREKMRVWQTEHQN